MIITRLLKRLFKKSQETSGAKDTGLSAESSQACADQKLVGSAVLSAKKKLAPGKKQPAEKGQSARKKKPARKESLEKQKQHEGKAAGAQPSKVTGVKAAESKAGQKSTWNISDFDVPVAEGKKRFHDFELPSELMQGICDLGFKYCTPIQAEVLSCTLQGGDAVGKAQTGTGKTAAFLITAVKLLLGTPPPQQRYLGEPRVVIIAPTRELALQIGEDAKALISHTSLRTVLLIGGMDYEKQQQQLASGWVDIVIATPGRLLDFFSSQIIFLDMTEILILDEADRMLDMGFIPQIRRIVSATPKPGDRQTLLFSATFNDDVLRLSEQWTWNPVRVEIEPDSVVTDAVDQKIYMVSRKDKYAILRNLVQRQGLKKVIVFANRRYETRDLAEKLIRDGIKAGSISGDVPQKKRLSTLDAFKSGKIHVLVATDVAGRGIHVDGISHVINYNLPENAEDYVHRVGRTGRAGNMGISVSFACEDDSFLIDDLETKLGEKLELTYPPEDLL